MLDLGTNKMTLIMSNDRYESLEFDNDLQLRMAVESRPDGGETYWLYDGKGSVYDNQSWTVGQ